MSKPESKTPKPKSAAKSPAKSPAKAPAAKKAEPALPLDEAILDVLTRNGRGTLSPPEIAHKIIEATKPDGDWHALLMPIRHAAVKLALADRLVIYRKGKPVEDPNDFRGVYRLGLPTAE